MPRMGRLHVSLLTDMLRILGVRNTTSSNITLHIPDNIMAFINRRDRRWFSSSKVDCDRNTTSERWGMESKSLRPKHAFTVITHKPIDLGEGFIPSNVSHVSPLCCGYVDDTFFACNSESEGDLFLRRINNLHPAFKIHFWEREHEQPSKHMVS